MPSTIDVVQLVLAAIEARQARAADDSIAVLTRLAPAIPPAFGDEPRLQEALEELLGNAMDRAAHGDTVTVGVTCDAGAIHIAVQLTTMTPVIMSIPHAKPS